MQTATPTTNQPMTDAELRAVRESLGMPIRELAQVLRVKEESLTEMEHGGVPVPTDISDRIAKIESITEEYIDRLIIESKQRGFVETYRFNAEMAARVPELSSFGSMWHRSCALQVQAHTNLPMRYPPRAQRIVV